MEILDTVMKGSCFWSPTEFKFHRLFCVILVQEDGYKCCTCNCSQKLTAISKTRLGTWYSDSCSFLVHTSHSIYTTASSAFQVSNGSGCCWKTVISCDKKHQEDTDHLVKGSAINKGWKQSRSAYSLGQERISVYRTRVSLLKWQNTES